MNKQISDQALLSQADKLPKEIQPERDLWSGIERAIQHKSQQKAVESNKNNVIPMAWAASLIAAVLVAWVAFAPTTSQLSSPLVVTDKDTLQPESGQLVSSMQTMFQQQKQATAQFFFNRMLPKITALDEQIRAGSDSLMQLEADLF